MFENSVYVDINFVPEDIEDIVAGWSGEGRVPRAALHLAHPQGLEDVYHQRGQARPRPRHTRLSQSE